MKKIPNEKIMRKKGILIQLPLPKQNQEFEKHCLNLGFWYAKQ